LEFVLSLMKSQFYVAQVEDVILGTDPPNISTGQMEGIMVPLIDEDEQSRIGAFLKQQHLIYEQYIALRTKASRLKTALMQDLLTGKVRVTPLLAESQEASA
jgi:type I restriction enzyme S subunit